jgi:hypothetical protein
MSKQFPDLTGDGKVTQADILKGRKVFAEGGNSERPSPGRASIFQPLEFLGVEQETIDKINKNATDIPTPIADAVEFLVIQAREAGIMSDPKKEREQKAEGGSMTLLVPFEGIKPDVEMENDYVSYVMDETLSDDEMTYVNKALESDNRLSELFDKIVLASAEFTGAGEVDGPGTGTSDEIPARLSDGEFVFTKKAVDQIGVETLEEMMKDAEAEYDASRQDMAVGGIMNDPTQDEKAVLPDEAMSDDEIEEQMLDSNRIPSLMRR